MTYLLIKYLHIIAAVFLFGFGMGSYLYLVAAHRTGDAKVIAAVARMVVRFDAWLTTPAGVLQLLTGYAMVKTAGLDWSSDWLLGALGVFFGVGALWLPVLVLQTRMQSCAAQAAAAGEPLGPDYQRLYRPWLWMGVAGFAGMFVVVLIMVTKQAPWQWLG
ncbi:DUF2269 domain-containing protein [Pseudomonas sp. Leaf58]|uniref:DUF2269 family protein n=1 Tax=Pseudomonas TaxID=286 RepID=UPI000701CEF6|nr:DUF2269 domain-containing protein [Pseudomonas sp. Leaf58]AYG44587.1 DUF2269 domain-containing protein [Pseudomonas sp. Leaf58]KQN61258.1 hypothetical protein ASF02_12825 [Pseudomonas sp. Leaf58]